MEIASMLAFMADWSTPAVLFCVLNLMIATIFIASNYNSPNNINNHHHHDNIPSQLTRSPSLLERVKSLNLSSFYTTPESHDQNQVDQYSDQPTSECNSASQLSRRSSSLLERVKSIDFSFSSFHNSVVTESEQLSNSSTERSRSPTLMDRVKSFKLASPFNSDQHSGDTASSKDEDSDIDPLKDSVEDNNFTNALERSGVTLVKRSPSKLRNSSSKKKVASSEDGEEDDDWQRQPLETRRAIRVPDESVDAKADDFIKRFKQQLKLQRLDSLQKLREMLNRGT
ncbi:hypothetical protein M8C21_026990 [Ambrosia artemisiifolia]|uniref:DUF4408 domain-containing protein n=1 Tax=Ambrosia artemisiifolia TaxID=4212 RepID=A0AAD5BPK1_AMBAR|nr:hypothetical protein M8C21_026990 [Ambrosia artemisiifolia]